MKARQYLTGMALAACLLGQAARAQVPGIKHAYAFVTMHQPGNIAVDPDGGPLRPGPDSVYTVYLETYGPGIQWQTAYLNGYPYSVAAYPVKTLHETAGIARQTKERILLAAGRGNCLWRLALTRGEPAAAPRLKTGTGHLLLEGRRGRKNVQLRIDTIVELEAIPAV